MNETPAMIDWLIMITEAANIKSINIGELSCSYILNFVINDQLTESDT